jgi:mRNA degradation ribonuclease J1/J2
LRPTSLSSSINKSIALLQQGKVATVVLTGDKKIEENILSFLIVEFDVYKR